MSGDEAATILNMPRLDVAEVGDLYGGPSSTVRSNSLLCSFWSGVPTNDIILSCVRVAAALLGWTTRRFRFPITCTTDGGECNDQLRTSEPKPVFA
jgi:hypothetical protein